MCNNATHKHINQKISEEKYACNVTVCKINTDNSFPPMMHHGDNRPPRKTPQPQHGITGVPAQKGTIRQPLPLMIADGHDGVHVETLVNKHTVDGQSQTHG